MKSLKTTAIVAFVFLLAGIFIGYKISTNPIIKKGTKTVKYLSSTKLKLPEFNKPSLEPTKRLVFLHGKTDTVFQSICEDYSDIMVPKDYTKDILLTERDPISQNDNDIQFRYYDPKLRSDVIDVYHIKPSPWRWSLRADVFTPFTSIDPIFGPRLRFGHRNLMLNVGAYLQPISRKAFVIGGLSVKIKGN